MTIAPITLDFSTRFGAEEVFNPLGFLQLVLICRVLVWDSMLSLLGRMTPGKRGLMLILLGSLASLDILGMELS
jgi:hypothetical protein